LKNILLILLALLLTVSCEKALIDKNPENDPQSNFDILWETVRDKYSFFGLKDINWDSVRVHYDPMVDDQTTDEELFAILDSMLYDLEDGHVNLVAPFNTSRNWQWYLGYPVNFNYDVVERNYLGPDHRIAGGLKYTLIDSIGYLYYGSFSSGFSEKNLKAMLDYFKGTKGVIVDVRDNGGGSLNNAFVLAQTFISEKKNALITFEKTGPALDDFGNGLSYSFGPSSFGHYEGEVVVLTNRSCYSATNTFVAILSNYANVRIVGDQTGGGGGIPIDQELPNGWRYRFSATASFTPDGYNIELGIPPDIALNNNPTTNAQGVDQILQRALNLLR
tara:strand:+ start:5894 stop:6892 length:999 start_codon:yes stop_codon:yes gene_type:complete